MYDLVAPAIREADPTTPIYYEPNLLFDFGASTATESPPVSNVGFAFHDYCLKESPNGCESEAINIAKAVKHVKKTKDALLLTEFGSSNHEGDLSGVVAKADANMVPWLEWAFCYCEDPLTTGGETEGLVKNTHEPPTRENVRSEILDALMEPYPQLISGTPTSWGFDRETKTFTLAYTPKRAGGGKKFTSRGHDRNRRTRSRISQRLYRLCDGRNGHIGTRRVHADAEPAGQAEDDLRHSQPKIGRLTQGAAGLARRPRPR